MYVWDVRGSVVCLHCVRVCVCCGGACACVCGRGGRGTGEGGGDHVFHWFIIVDQYEFVTGVLNVRYLFLQRANAPQALVTTHDSVRLYLIGRDLVFNFVKPLHKPTE